MGHREVRPVALDWEHPREPGTYSDGSPRYLPLHNRRRLLEVARWNSEHPDMAEEDEYGPDDYMPVLPEGSPYGYQLYETTTEGTPVSPIFGSLEELADWCETGATVFADYQWTREQWLASFKADTLDADSLFYTVPKGMGPLGSVPPVPAEGEGPIQ